MTRKLKPRACTASWSPDNGASLSFWPEWRKSAPHADDKLTATLHRSDDMKY